MLRGVSMSSRYALVIGALLLGIYGTFPNKAQAQFDQILRNIIIPSLQSAPQTRYPNPAQGSVGNSFGLPAERDSEGPSFDCRRAYDVPAQAICRDSELSRLDREMASSFVNVLRSGYDVRTLKNEQKLWLLERSRCGTNRACLQASISQRTAQLNVLSGTSNSQILGAQRVTGLTGGSFGQSNSGLQLPSRRTLGGAVVLDQSDPLSVSNYFMLVALGIKPTLIENQPQAYASRFLPKSNRFTDMSAWGSGNEFNDADFRRAFLDQYATSLRAAAPTAPFTFVYAQPADLGRYDEQRHGFPILKRESGYLGEATALGLRFNGTLIPDASFWPMPEAKARHVLEDVKRGGSRRVVVSTTVQVDSADPTSMTLNTHWTQCRVFDQDLQTLLYDFGAPAEAPPPISETFNTHNQLVRWTAPPLGFRPWRFDDLDGVPVIIDQLNLMRMVGAGNIPDYFTRGDIFYQRQAMFKTMLEPDIYNKYFINDHFRGNNEFERGQLIDDFSKRYLQVFRDLAPKPPFEFVAVQKSQLREYDSARQGFPLIGSREFGIIGNAQNAGVNLTSSFAWPELFWSIPAESAQRVLAQLPSDRSIQIAARLSMETADSSRSKLTLRIKSLKAYAIGTKSILYEFPVTNDFDSQSVAVRALKFNATPSFDNILVCSELLSANDYPGREKQIAFCAGLVRERDMRTYADSSLMARLSQEDAMAPFFPRGGVSVDPEAKRRFIQWASEYASAASQQPISYIANRHQRSNDQMSYEAVGHSDNASGRNWTRLLAEKHVRAGQIVSYGRLNDLPVVLILPNLSSEYSISVPTNSLNADSDGGATAVTSLRIGAPQMVQDDGGTWILALNVRPLRIDITTHQGDRLASRDFADIPDFGSPILKPGKEEKETPLLTASLIDLLTAKYIGTRMPSEALAYLVARRWLYESKENGPIDRFFQVGTPAINAETAAAQAVSFISWANDHGPSLPVDVNVKTPLNITSSHTTINWGSVSCFTGSYASLMSDNSRNMALNSQLISCQRHDAEATDEEKAECQSLKSNAAFKDLIRELSGECRSNDIRFSFADPLHAFARLDRNPPAPVVTALGGKQSVIATLTLRINQIAAFTHKPDISDKFDTINTPTASDDGALKSAYDYPTLDIQLINTSYVDAQSGAPVAVLSGLEAASPAIQPKEDTQLNPPPVASLRRDADGPDIVGVRLGMSFEDAEGLIRAHMAVGKVLQGSRAYDKNAAAGFIKPLTSGKLFVSADEKEIIAILDEPPTVTGRVMAAWRRIYVATDTVMPADLIPDLKKKYGEPIQGIPFESNGQAKWSLPSGRRCSSLYNSTHATPLSESWFENGAPSALASTNPHGMKGPNITVALLDTLNPIYDKWENCGPFISLYFLQSHGLMGPMDELDTTLTDVGLYRRAYKESRTQSQKAANGSSQESPAPRIKF